MRHQRFGSAAIEIVKPLQNPGLDAESSAQTFSELFQASWAGLLQALLGRPPSLVEGSNCGKIDLPVAIACSGVKFLQQRCGL